MKLKRAGILTVIIVAALLVYAVVSLVNLRGRITEAQEKAETLQSEVDKKTAENEDLEYAIEHKDEDEVRKQVAQDKLGLSEYDEKIFIAE